VVKIFAFLDLERRVGKGKIVSYRETIVFSYQIGLALKKTMVIFLGLLYVPIGHFKTTALVDVRVKLRLKMLIYWM